MSEKRHHHHHWKLWLTLILIVGIAGLLMYTDAGRKTLNFFKIGRFININPTAAQQFSIVLNANQGAFYSQSYTMTNSSINAKGVCQGSILVGEITINRMILDCDLALNDFNGNIDYTDGGTMLFTGKVTTMRIDDDIFSSPNGIQVKVGVIPTDCFLQNLRSNKIALPTTTGSISKLKADGTASLVAYLNQDSLEINNFSGYLQLENGQITLMGMVSSVKSQEFSW